MARIFISYKRKNKEQVFQLVNYIESQLGEKCWVDLDGIESSAQFASVICKAIDAADVVLFMHSFVHLDIDFENDWTIKELNYAQAKKKRIVLVKLDSSPLDNIFLMDYGSKNNIDSNDQSQLQKLIKDLRIFLNISTPNNSDDDESEEIPLRICDNREGRLFDVNAEKNIRYGFKDNDGTVVIPCIWKQVNAFHEGLALVQNENGEWGWINKAGQVVLQCKWTDAFDFSEGLACVKDTNNKKWGFIDRTGKLVIPFNWKTAGSFHEGMAFVANDMDKYGYINRYGKVIIPFIWNDAFHFSEGLAGIRNDNWKWGFINKNGELVISCKWEGVYSFHEGLAIVTNDHEKYGYIDKTGKIIIPIIYRDARNFSNGKAYVDGEYIDKTGQVVINREEVRENESKTIWEAAAKEVMEERKSDFSFMKLPKERLKLLREGLPNSSENLKDVSQESKTNRSKALTEILNRIKF